MRGLSVNPYPPQLVHDIAIGLDDTTTILKRHNISEAEYDELCQNPSFRAAIVKQSREYQEQGVSFKLKAKALAEHHLVLMNELITDPEVPPNIRLEALSKLTEWSDLYNKKAPPPTNNTQVNAETVSITFNMGTS